MNITEELNKIIINYNLDHYYPRFQKNLKAEEIVKNMMNGKLEQGQSMLLIGTQKEDVLYTKGLLNDYTKVTSMILERDSEIPDVGIYDNVYFVSYHACEWACQKLDVNEISYVNIYDVFLKEDLIFEDEYYNFLPKGIMYELLIQNGDPWTGWKEMVTLEYINQYKKYEKTSDEAIKKIAMEKCFFLALYVRNFVEAKKCVRLLASICKERHYEEAWIEIEELLKKIKKELSHRKCKDIIVYWLDSLSYHKTSEMPFYNNLAERSTSFINAFTEAPTTLPTLKHLFACASCSNLEDKGYAKSEINAETSGLLSYLKQEDYEVKICSFLWFEKHINGSAEMVRLEKREMPASKIFWDVLEEIVKSKDKLFIVGHEFQTHPHFWSLRWHELDELTYENMGKMARLEVDEQLNFYSEFWNKHTQVILLSDHGDGCVQERYHIIMNVYSQMETARKITNMFSTKDFLVLVKQIVEKGRVEETAFTREYIPIEEYDQYDYHGIRWFIEKVRSFSLYYFGYRGLIKEGQIYLRFSTGEERICKDGESDIRLTLGYNRKNSKEKEQLRGLVKAYPLELLQEEKFKYAMLCHKLYKIWKERETLLLNAVENVIKAYPDNSVAIRMGGVHSVEFYEILSDECKNKIVGFVDNQQACRCAKFGKKIFTLDEISESSIKAVILSSFKYLDMLREETKFYPENVDVIDIYQIWSDNGVCYIRDFYGQDLLYDEDYERIIKEESDLFSESISFWR